MDFQQTPTRLQAKQTPSILPPDTHWTPTGLPPDCHQTPIKEDSPANSKQISIWRAHLESTSEETILKTASRLPVDSQQTPTGLPPDSHVTPTGLPPDSHQTPTELPPNSYPTPSRLPVDSQQIRLPANSKQVSFWRAHLENRFGELYWRAHILKAHSKNCF